MRAGLIASVLSAYSLQAEPLLDRFETLDRNLWHVAEYDFIHPAFDTDWCSSQAVADNGLRLKLSPHDGLNRFVGASIRSLETHHYGIYRSRFRAGKGDDVVTGFFTYTGPHYGTRHDEINIEILGKDPTRLHVAWFVDGELTNHFIPLGFDASESVNDYACEWSVNGIRWYVNDALVFEASANDGPLPSIAVWSGVVEPATTTSAYFDSISFEPIATASTSDANS